MDYDFFKNAFSCHGKVGYECDPRHSTVEGISIPLPEGKKREDVKYLYIYDSRTDLVPTDFKPFFPNLNAFRCIYCQIAFVENSDFDQFPNLKWLDLGGNIITFLPGDLFKNHKGLEYFSVSQNPIKYIGEGLFDPIPNLKYVSFFDTKCTPEELEGTLEARKKIIIASCTRKSSSVKKNLKKKVKPVKSLKRFNDHWLVKCEKDFLMLEDL
jgi:hypothetical protein